MVLAYKGDHSSMNVVGFAPTAQCVAVFDGKSDAFASCLPVVKKKFHDTQAIRKFMDITETCKVFAIVLDEFVSKGHYTYEVAIAKPLRSGYGKGNVKFLKPSNNTSAQAMQAFFGKTPLPSDGATGSGVRSAPVEDVATVQVQSVSQNQMIRSTTVLIWCWLYVYCFFQVVNHALLPITDAMPFR